MILLKIITALNDQEYQILSSQYTAINFAKISILDVLLNSEYTPIVYNWQVFLSVFYLMTNTEVYIGPHFSLFEEVTVK